MPHRARQVFVVLAGNVFAALLAASSAHATLSVTRRAGAEACPDEQAFARRMHSDAGDRAPFDGKDIRVEFERTPSGYRSFVQLANGAKRSLSDDASTCEGIADATALAIKLALDLEMDATTPTAPSTPAQPSSGGAPSVQQDASPPAPEDAPRRAARAELSAGAVVVAGLATPIATGVRGGAAFSWHGGRWSLGLTALALPAQTVNVGEGTVDVSVLGGGIEGCGRSPVRGTLGAALCARVEGLRMHGRARGYARSEEDARPLFTTSLVARGHGRVVGPLSIFLELGAVAPIVRERFAIDTVGPVYDPPIVGGTAGIGAVVDFE